jgi:predicted glycoside hydrolase/deacetylase ChbG (UPF0249 family)
MKFLIVNADDFGISEKINEGIITAHKEGIVSSTTLMANSPCFESSVKILKKNRLLGVGIHLNLTDGEALDKSLEQISGRAGFLSSANIKLALNRKINLCEVESEFRAQIIRVQESRLEITHLDSHKHVHTFPGIQNIVLKLAKEFNITKIRVPYDMSPLNSLIFSKQFPKRVLINYLSRRFKAKTRRLGIDSADKFFGILETGNLDFKRLTRVIEALPNGVSEIMCHPGYFDPTIGGSLIASRVIELNALTHPKIKEVIKRRGIHLINYGDL